MVGDNDKYFYYLELCGERAGELCHISMLGDKVKLEDMLVINEYPNVFPDELESLPLEREIEFKIDLVPETTLISKTPYQMAPIKFKELKL